MITFNIPVPVNQQWATIQLVSDLPAIGSNTTIDGFTQPGSGTAGSGRRPGVADSGNNCPVMTFPRPGVAIRGAQTHTHTIAAMSIDGAASNVLIRGLAIYNVSGPSIEIAAVLGLEALSLGSAPTNRVLDTMFIGLLPDGTDPGMAERDLWFGARQRSPGYLTVTSSLVGFNGRGGIDGLRSESVITVTKNEVLENGWNSLAHDGIDFNGINGLGRCNESHDNTTLGNASNGGGGNGIEVGSKDPVGAYGVFDNNVIEYNTLHGNVSSGISIRQGPTGDTVRKNVIYENEVGISINRESIETHLNVLTMNSTFRNNDLGIDLQHAGTDVTEWSPMPDGGNDTMATGQDHCDPDPGSNDLQNYPILTSVVGSDTNMNIQGTLDSTANTWFRIEFFSFLSTDLVNVLGREGKRFLGSVVVQTNALCSASFIFTSGNRVPRHLKDDDDDEDGTKSDDGKVADDDPITATATPISEPGMSPDNTPRSTSEYSPAVPAVVPMQGKVTGGGWYHQPANGIPAPTSSDDRANFGLNAQYKDSDPTPHGHTNFHYRPAGLHFGSTSYDTGSLQFATDLASGGKNAQWTGQGKLNGVPGYCFQANVQEDGEGTGEQRMDKFRIKIWQPATAGDCSTQAAVIYDNDPTVTLTLQLGTILGGGDIDVHKQ